MESGPKEEMTVLRLWLHQRRFSALTSGLKNALHRCDQCLLCITLTRSELKA